MAIMPITVTFGASLTTLGNVQSVSYQLGRRFIADPYNVGSAQIVCRDISSWSTIPKVGDNLVIKTTGLSFFNGAISDVDIVYGKIPALDYAIITGESPCALLGRRNLKAKVMAQATTTSQFDTIMSSCGLSWNTIAPGKSTAIAQTYTGNAFDYVNTLALTEVGRIVEQSFDTLAMFPRNRYNTSEPVYGSIICSDTNTQYIQVDELNFRSTAENYYTRVTTQPLTLDSQVNNTGSAPYYSFTVNTFDYTTSQANSLSQYYLGAFSSKTSAPTSVVARYAQQPFFGSTAQSRFTRALTFGSTIGAQMAVTFRGTQYNMIVEGVSFSADIQSRDVTVEWFVSPQDVNAYLILDDTTFGTLGTSSTYPGNKLGF